MTDIKAKYYGIFETSGNQIVDRLLDEIDEIKFDVGYLADHPNMINTNSSHNQRLSVINNFINLGNSKYSSVAIYNTSGFKIVDSGNLSGKFNSSAVFFNQVSKDKILFDSMLNRISKNQNGFHFSTPLYNGSNYITGILDVRVPDNFIYKIINSSIFSLNHENNAFKFTIDLIHDNGFLIFTTRDNVSYLENSTFSKNIDNILNYSSELNDQSNKGNSVLIPISVPLLSPEMRSTGNWTLLLESDYISLVDDYNKTVRDFLLSSSLILIAAIVVTIILVNRITSPITHLKDSALELSRNKFGKEIMVEGSSEVKDLSISLEVMRRNIENSKKNLIRKVKERTKELEKVNEELIAKEFEVNLINEELMKSNKAKEEFLSMVSHELKTPITPMKLYIEMLLKVNKVNELNPFQRKALSIVHKNILKLETIINDIFTVYRMELDTFRISKKVTNVSDLIESNLSALAPLMREKNIQFSSIVNTSEKVLCDPVRISQVFFNLVNNAVDHVPEVGGRITIRADDVNDNDKLKSQDNPTTPAHKKRKKKIVFTVEDNGIGIHENNIDGLFKKFYQIDTGLSRKYGGTGLGLAICKGIIESHGGSIWIESTYKDGASFKFTLNSN